MRLLLFLGLAVLAGCDGASDEVGSGDPAADTEAEAEADAPPERVAEPAPDTPAQPMTTGFIEARVGGELKRFEHLVAAHNTAATNGTFLEAMASPDSEESFKFALVNLDVREMEFPASIVTRVRSMQMAGMNYWDPEGVGHPLTFVGDNALECESLEELRLTCTFSGTARPRRGEPVEITDGRLEVQLTTDEVRDRLMDRIPGATGRR